MRYHIYDRLALTDRVVEGVDLARDLLDHYFPALADMLAHDVQPLPGTDAWSLLVLISETGGRASVGWDLPPDILRRLSTLGIDVQPVLEAVR
mgnify:CR=1 FL=1